MWDVLIDIAAEVAKEVVKDIVNNWEEIKDMNIFSNAKKPIDIFFPPIPPIFF